MKAILAIALLLLAFDANARDQGEVRRFKRAHPCPFTVAQGCIVDHIKPLCLGGADKAWNMQWQTRRASYRKDNWERKKCRALQRSLHSSSEPGSRTNRMHPK